jgi:hypothetical protein
MRDGMKRGKRMKEFKIMDRVEMVRDFYGILKAGDKGTITNIKTCFNPPQILVDWDRHLGEGYPESGHGHYITESYLKPIPATLSTGDMLNAIQPRQLYISQEEPSNPVSLIGEDLSWKSGEDFTINSIVMQYRWTLVPEPPKPVSIEEAAKASGDGKTIICKFPNFNNPLDEWTTECRPSEAYLTFHMIHTGKWYIKDE